MLPTGHKARAGGAGPGDARPFPTQRTDSTERLPRCSDPGQENEGAINPVNGWAGFQLGGEGVDTALWLAPPPPPPLPLKRAQLTGPPNPTETDPRGPGGGPDPNSAKK